MNIDHAPAEAQVTTTYITLFENGLYIPLKYLYCTHPADDKLIVGKLATHPGQIEFVASNPWTKDRLLENTELSKELLTVQVI